MSPGRHFRRHFGRGRGRAARRGFTVLEMVVALVIFSAVGYALMGAVDMGESSSKQVIQKAQSNAELRRSIRELTSELSMAEAASIAVTELPSGNHQIEFREPIDLGGMATGWGVDEPLRGVQEGWCLRYTVEAAALGGELNYRLVRQVVDDEDAVQESRVVAEHLLPGDTGELGFECVLAGEVWVITLRTTAKGKEMEFHVRVRN